MSVSLYRKLQNVPPDLREVLLSLFEEVERNREESVSKKEFVELKEVVRELADAQLKTDKQLGVLTAKVEELAEAQKRTETRLNALASKVEELAEAQKRTEARLEELAEAQKRTEARLEELAEAQTRTEKEVASLARGLKVTREQLGGLSKSMAYALENEAYRKLPAYLASAHGIRVKERIVRADVADEEINFFARAEKDGKPVILVGESVLRLDDASKLKSLMDKVEKVGSVYGDELVPILVTHFAKPKVLDKARQAGICVVQSFEWDESP
ncbi:MAG: hypothetical protein WHS86_15250 [Desulfosoma sp.]